MIHVVFKILLNIEGVFCLQQWIIRKVSLTSEWKIDWGHES